jgi:hypothetical protein
MDKGIDLTSVQHKLQRGVLVLVAQILTEQIVTKTYNKLAPKYFKR